MRRPLRLFGLLAVVLGVSAGVVGDEDRPAGKPQTAAQVEGRRLFLEAAARVAAGRTDLGRVRDLFIDLEDVHTERRGSQHDGYLRIYYQAPDRFRWEQRVRKTDPPVRKLLDGNRMWISTVDEGGRWRVLARHGRPDGAVAVRRLQEDRDRFANLARFLSLGGLVGPGVTFESEGVLTRPPGHHLAGTWLKVRRRTSGGRSMAFLFAPEERGDGRKHAGWPAAVLLPGDPAQGEPAEHYVLQGWKKVGRTPRPRRIGAWTPDPKTGVFRETLRAFPVALRINEGIEASRFEPADLTAPGR